MVFRWLLFCLILAALLPSCKPERLPFKNTAYRVDRALKAERIRFKEEHIQIIIGETLFGKAAMEHQEAWQSAFWAMGLLQHRSVPVRKQIAVVMQNLDDYDPAFQRAALEAGTTLYPDAFYQEISAFTRQTGDPRLFAMGVCYLQRAVKGLKPAQLLLLLRERFPGWESDPILNRLYLDLSAFFPVMAVEKPPIKDLLQYRFGKDKITFFSFQRKNRDYPGLVAIRKTDGNFYRDRQGNILLVSQFSRSLSNLPGYITNGNTPQGIYSVKGTGISENVFIGPSPNIQMRLPWEISVSGFFHADSLSGLKWSRPLYERLLPESWRSYEPIFEAYYAGEAGRTEIIAHGTTINPEFYHGRSFYPFTPSLGCLTTMELWSDVNGTCLYSGQLSLVSAYRELGTEDAFYVVVEMDDRQEAVTAGEVVPYLLNSEASRSF